MAKNLTINTNTGRLGFTVVSREDEDTGATRYYAALVPYDTLDEQFINEWAAQFMKVSEAQMRVAFEALADAIEYFVLSGHSVTLNGLGNFTFSTRTGLWDEQHNKWVSAGRNSMDDVKASDIRATYVRFRPASGLNIKLGAASLFCADDTAFGKQTTGQA
jgi:hypothetical protein